MTDKRHPPEQNLAVEQESPGAPAPGDAPDGHAAPVEGDARPDRAEQAAAEAASSAEADEEALRGDVDELVAAAAQRDEYLALAQRTQADFENYRKRVAKESVAAAERGVVKLAHELLPALDNLDRALAQGPAPHGGGGENPLLAGVRLVRSELHAALARVGIEAFSPKGQAFDPAEHEALAQTPSPGVASGTIVEVIAPGYRLGKHIIRPARVVVAG
jgi:molecular chaperone GrpE